MKLLPTDHLKFKYDLDCVERLRKSFQTDAYVGKNGELHWKSNGAVIGLDTFKSGCVEAPATQQAEYEQDVKKSLAEYRKAKENYQYSAEELFEMKAAFGEGTTVVDILTGKKTKL
jgi:hypothetical protein